MAAAGFSARVCQPSTLRIVIWPEASNAQNSIAAVSADGNTVWVLIRRLNSSCSRSMALVVRADFHWLWGKRRKANRRSPASSRLAATPANAKDLHRPLSEADDLDEILAWREERKLTRNLTLRYNRMMLLLDPTPLARGLAGRTVEVVNYPDGRFAVRHHGVALPFRMFDKIETVSPGAI